MNNIKIPSNTKDLEFEIKFGTFFNKQFSADVNNVLFYSIFKYVEKDNVTYKRSVSCKDNNIRIEYFLDPSNKLLNIETVKKDKIQQINDYNLNIRYSLAKEIPITYNKKGKCFRYKERRSVRYKDWSFDFTRIYDIHPKNAMNFNEFLKMKKSPHRNELELEYKGDYSKLNQKVKNILDELKPFMNLKYTILKHIQSKLDNPEYKRIKHLEPRLWNSKQLMTQVQGLSFESFEDIKKDYSVTEKADGERFFLYVDKEHYLIDRSLNLELVKKPFSNEGFYLLDVEKINNLILIFDVIIFNNKDVSTLSFDERYKLLHKLKLNNDFKIKHFYFKGNIFENCKKVLETKFPYHIDGLIFTPISQQYRTDVYKWKPLDEQTIDFLIILKSKDNADLYVSARKDIVKHYNKSIFKNLEHSKFLPFLFIKDNKISYKNFESNQIVEMKFKNGIWIPYRIRTDKTKDYRESLKKGVFNGPNGITTAKAVIESIKNPITKEMITTGQVYYTGVNRNKAVILAMNKYNNHVKKQLYDKYLKKDMNLLELSGGRGGDLSWKILPHKPKFVLFTNFAKDALIEAERRYRESKFKNTNVIFKEFDLRNNVSNEIKKLSKCNFDIVSCQFAIHYMMKNDKTLENFFNNVNTCLNKNGIFMFTCFDGRKIERLLNRYNKNEELEFKIGNVKGMALSRHYNKNNKNKLGKEISVYVQTIGSHSLEYIVDLDHLISYFESKGYKLLENKSFDEYYSHYKGPKMSNSEKKFTFLYNAVVLQK